MGWVKSLFTSICYLSECIIFLFILVFKQYWSSFNLNGLYIIWPVCIKHNLALLLFFQKNSNKGTPNNNLRKQVLLFIHLPTIIKLILCWHIIQTYFRCSTNNLFEFPLLIHVRFNVKLLDRLIYECLELIIKH